ncbi:RarD, putative [Babesia ovis]|uniref:RarD, putative n=1 Tax=Babesia ovis TaxID=5869 RepID=A0A9W5TAD6_BABOV|nr:RarD, putative [Babesia ovis]
MFGYSEKASGSVKPIPTATHIGRFFSLQYNTMSMVLLTTMLLGCTIVSGEKSKSPIDDVGTTDAVVTIWYKSITFWVILGVVILALALICYFGYECQKKSGLQNAAIGVGIGSAILVVAVGVIYYYRNNVQNVLNEWFKEDPSNKVGRFTIGETIFVVLGILTLLLFVIVAVLYVLMNVTEAGKSISEVFQSLVDGNATGVIVPLFVFLCFVGSVGFSFFCYYLWHIDVECGVCQKVALILGVLLFVAFVCVVLLEIYTKLVHGSGGQSQDCKATLWSTIIMTSLSLILFIAFQAAVYRQDAMCKPYCNRQKAFIGLSVVVTVLMLVILATKAYYCANQSTGAHISTSSAALVMVCFPAVIAILWLSCDLDFIGHQFTPMEIAFGVLSILIGVMMLVEVLFVLNGKAKGKHHSAPLILVVIAIVLVIPWVYCACRLHVFDAIFTSKTVTPEKVEPKEYPYGTRVIKEKGKGSEGMLAYRIRT